MLWLVAVVSLGLINLCEAQFNTTTFTPTTWSSCSSPPITFNSSNNAIVTGCEIISTTTTSNFSITPNTNTCLPPLNSFAYGTYTFAVIVSGQQYNYSTPIVVTPSPISNATISIDAKTYRAGLNITVNVVPFASCNQITMCSQNNLTFSVAVRGVSTQPNIIYTQSPTQCQFIITNLTTVGSYYDLVSFNGTIFANQSFTVVAGAVDAAKCSANIAPNLQVTSSVPSCFNVTVYDSYQNLCTGLQISSFVLNYRNSSQSIGTYYINATYQGTYTICFTPETAGFAYLGVQVVATTSNVLQDIAGSPFNITVIPGAFSPSASDLEDSGYCSIDPYCATQTGLTDPIAGAVSQFSVVLRDAVGNVKSSSSDVNVPGFLLQFYLTTGGGTIWTGNVTARNDTQSAFLASYILTQVGSYVVNMTYFGQQIGEFQPIVGLSPATVSFANCIYNPPPTNISAGSSFSASISAFDAYNNSVSGGSWTAYATYGSSSVSCPVAETTSGVYTATCTITTIGPFIFQFFFNGVPFSTPNTTPSSVQVYPGLFSYTASNYTWTSSVIMAGQNTTVTSYLYDQYGNIATKLAVEALRTLLQPVAGKGLKFSTTVSSFVSPNIYVSSFVLTAVGNYSISVTIDGTALSTQLFPYVVVTPAQTNGQSCTISPNASSWTVGVPAFFLITAMDAYMNVQTSVNETSLFAVNFVDSASGTVSANIANTAAGNGYYLASFTPKVAGLYYAAGYYNGVVSFASNVFQVSAAQPSSSTTTFASGSIGQTTATAGTPSTILIQAEDFYGNDLEELANVTVTISNSQINLVVPLDSSRSSPLFGISAFTYTLNVSGTYTVEVYLNQQPLKQSILVVSPALAVSTTLDFTGPSSLTLGDAAYFYLGLTDQFGNPSNGADVVICNFVGTDFTEFIFAPTYFDNNLGKYVIFFNTSVAGLYNVDLTVNTNIQLTRTISVVTTYGGYCTTFTSSINQGQVWILTCFAWDIYGRDKTTGGDTVNVVADSASTSVTDNGNGQYSISYSSQSIGYHPVNISIDGKPCPDMPLYVTVIAGAIVLGTVIPAVFIFGLLVILIAYCVHKRRTEYQRLLRTKRKPQQVFSQEEWSDEEEDDSREDWFAKHRNDDEELKLRLAHELALKELEA